MREQTSSPQRLHNSNSKSNPDPKTNSLFLNILFASDFHIIQQ